MSDPITDLMMKGGTQAAPASSAGNEHLTDQTMRGMETQMRPKEGLSPMQVNPKAKQVGAGKQLAAGVASMFVPFLGQAIQSQAKAQKEAQITEAMNEFNSLNDGLEMASSMAQMEALQGKIPEEKVHERTQELWKEQPSYKAMFDPMNPAAKKRIKNFAKVFQQDWMNPEKAESTVHSQGLQRFMKMKPHQKMVQQLAQQIQQKQGQGGAPPPQQPGGGQPQPQQGGGQQPQQGQPQQSPQQGGQPPSGEQMQHKLNMPDPKAMTPYAEYLKAVEAVRNRYEFRADNEGKPFAFDKRDGSAKEIKVQKADGTEGTTPTMATKGLTGKVAIVDGVPFGVYGVTDNGQQGVKHPGDKNWTGADAKTFEASKAAWAQGEASKDKRVKLSADFRAKAWAATRQYGVYDTETGNMVMANALEISANRGKFAPAPQAMQLTNRTNLFNEIEGTENELKSVIAEMRDVKFDEATKAQLAAVMKADAPNSMLDAFLKSNAAGTLTDPQIRYVTALAAMEESALSLRTLGGMGAGSDQMRAAILRMLPGGGTPSAAYATRQLQLFDIEVKGLKKNQPGLGNIGGRKGDKKQSFSEFLNGR